MRIPSDDEKSRIRSTLEPLTSKKEVSGICVYGSQVAGYARKDSDYDVIVALRPFHQRIKYYYLRGEVDCSALVVNSRSFISDCASSKLGEFVSGRLLNPYVSLDGSDFIEQNEVIYKRRVILEGLIDACAENEDFASELIFHLPYFLFEKLKKRAAIYPPVVYSYSMTYGEKLSDPNVENAIKGFRHAAELLSAEGLISYDSRSDCMKLGHHNFRGGIMGKLSSAALYTTKSLRQYAVHGYAGRVRPTVIGKELVAKVSRSRNHSTLPEMIHYPKNHLSIAEGVLFADVEDWMAALMEYLSVHEQETRVAQKTLGELYAASSIYTLEDQKRRFSFAVKRFKDIKGMKWGILNLWSLRNADFVVNPLTRMFREYHGLREFRKLGLRTPEIIAVFLSQRILVTKFIQGKGLSQLQSEYLNGEMDDLDPFAKFGKALAVVHNNGYCLGDSKPSNAIFADSDSEIYLTDLEQSHEGGNPAWDVAEFIYFSVRFTMKEERVRRLISAFVSGYMKQIEDKTIVEKTAALRYRAPFQPFIAPNVLSAVLRDLRNTKT